MFYGKFPLRFPQQLLRNKCRYVRHRHNLHGVCGPRDFTDMIQCQSMGVMSLSTAARFVPPGGVSSAMRACLGTCICNFLDAGLLVLGDPWMESRLQLD